MEDDLKFLVNGRQPQKNLNGRRPQFIVYGNEPQFCQLKQHVSSLNASIFCCRWKITTVNF
jgi:hypothetical protein